jgi:hypothetical protein
MSRNWEDIGYKEAIENCRTWNSQMTHRRQKRLPYYDDHTQTHQDKCGLYLKESSRLVCGGSTSVRYPGRKWVKKGETGSKTGNGNKMLCDDPIMEIRLFEDSYNRELMARALANPPTDYLASFDDIGDGSDEEYGRKKSRSRRSRQSANGIGGSGGRDHSTGRRTRKSRIKQISIDDDYDQIEPSHFCPLCGESFIHKSALAYHMKNSHESPEVQNPVLKQLPPPPPLQKAPPQFMHQTCVLCHHPSIPGRIGLDQMLICTDCKKHHHPECMNFNQQMTATIKKYNWQCTDCKSCDKCGKSENDESILFCDKCDRGFHMYCLDPPLTEPPNGAWLCRHCK